jgi:hypothetical protein
MTGMRAALRRATNSTRTAPQAIGARFFSIITWKTCGCWCAALCTCTALRRAT